MLSKQDSLLNYYNHHLRFKREVRGLNEFPESIYEELKYPKLFDIERVGVKNGNKTEFRISYYLYGLSEFSYKDSCESDTSIRAIFLSTFRYPMVIKILKNKGTTTLIYKKTSGIYGYYVGEIDEFVEKKLQDSTWRNIVEMISENGFFNKQEFDFSENGVDGADIVIEYRDNSKYHYYYINRIESANAWVMIFLGLVNTKPDLNYVSNVQ